MKIFIGSVGNVVFELNAQDCRREILLGSIRKEMKELHEKYPLAPVVESDLLK